MGQLKLSKMKPLIFLLLLTISQITNCQRAASKYAGTYKEEVDKNIFRVMATAALDESLTFSLCYEHEIYKHFTIVVKAGPTFSFKYASRDAFGNDEYMISLKGVASAELRCYYNLNRRLKHKKTVRNFSAYYVSLEPFVISSPVFILNNTDAETSPGKSGVYINIGFQKQISRAYFNAFFGTRFFGSIYSHSVDVFDIIQGGITFGRVF